MIVLGIGSLVWDRFGCVPSFSDADADADTSVVETPVAPEDTAVVDAGLARRLADYVHAAPRIDTAGLGVYVYDLTARDVVYAHHDVRPMVPASCTKLLTSVVALYRLGPEHVYDSRLLMYGTLSHGTLCGTLIVSMDDDPFFTTFNDFARELGQCGVQRVEGSIVFDLARTDTLRQHHTASPWDISYHRVPLLMKGEKRVKQEFMQALSSQGIAYRPNVLFAHPWLQGLAATSRPAEYRVALSLARAQSVILARTTHSLREVMAPMMLYSDNILAEAIRFHAAHALDRWTGPELTTADVTNQFVREVLSPESADTLGLVVNDGSGLSPANRFTPRFLVRLLTYAYDHPFMHRILMDELLPTALSERSGTLYGRMRDEHCRGRIFAKTGTLTAKGVSSLSGYCLGSNGHWYAFAILNEDMAVYESRIFQDRFCAILAGK